MNRISVIEKLVGSMLKYDAYTIHRSGTRVMVSDKSGSQIGTIQFNDSPNQLGCIIRTGSQLSAQCEYLANKGWLIYPIQQGKVARLPVRNSNPVQFLTKHSGTMSLVSVSR